VLGERGGEGEEEERREQWQRLEEGANVLEAGGCL